MPLYLKFLFFVFAVIQQPIGFASYVSETPDVVTQFGLVCCGNVGILAHNYEAGQYFDELSIGDTIDLIYPTRTVRYEVVDIRRYYALSPYSVSSTFQEVETGKFLSAEQLFYFVYGSSVDRRLVLQTCFDGVKGRLFIIAYPMHYDRANGNTIIR